jgi:hypothetical protein
MDEKRRKSSHRFDWGYAHASAHAERRGCLGAILRPWRGPLKGTEPARMRNKRDPAALGEWFIRRGGPFMPTRFQIAWLVFMMTNAVIFGVGIVPVLAIPALAAHAFVLIPIVVVASVLIGAPLAWFIAPRLRARYWRHRSSGDAVAGRA